MGGIADSVRRARRAGDGLCGFVTSNAVGWFADTRVYGNSPVPTAKWIIQDLPVCHANDLSDLCHSAGIEAVTIGSLSLCLGGTAMNDVTQILSQIESGDPSAAGQLLPLVYDELRKLAAAKLASEKPGQTLQATALVHEAYLRPVGPADLEPQQWNSRGHFFGAPAEAMRRILVENARRRARVKHGGDHDREELFPSNIIAPDVSEDLIALDEALERLVEHDPQSAELVKLRYFAGLTIRQAAELLGMSPRKADSLWLFARAWLRREIGEP
jgi:RNA polymerase sigma factor (TIGR02999 family)